MVSKGIHVIKTKDGKEVYHLYCQCQPERILMDICMPKLDGYQVTALEEDTVRLYAAYGDSCAKG